MIMDVHFARHWLSAALVALIVLGVAAEHRSIIEKARQTNPSVAHLSHPDEVIASAVLDHLRAARSLDTNWRDAELPPAFKSSQYNFSGYLITLFALSRVVDLLPPSMRTMDRQSALRAFSALCAAAAVLLVAAIGATLGGPMAAVIAALLAALSPSLFLDGLYARPDAYYVLISLLLLLVYLWRGRFTRAWIPVAAALVGFLLSIKVSSLPFGLLLIPAALEPRGRSRPEFSLSGLLLAIVFVAIGFALGAPGAIVHPDEFLAGVRFLSNQYSDAFGPHGLGRDSSLLERLGYAATWILQTWGLALPFAIAGVGVLVKRRLWDALFGFSPYAFTLIFFMLTAAFFERNMAPGIAAFAALAGVAVHALAASVSSRISVRVAVAATLTVLVVAVPAWVDVKIVKSIFTVHDMREEVIGVGRKYHRDVQVVGWARPPWSTLPVRNTPCDPPIVLVIHAGDRRALSWIHEATSAGWVEVYRQDSAFAGFIPSTLHTYLSASSVYLMKMPPVVEGPTDDCGWARFDWGG